MARTLLFLLLAGLAACSRTDKNIPVPSDNPHILKPAKYLPVKGKVIDMDSVAKPRVVPARGRYVKARRTEYIPEKSNYHLAGEPKYIQAKGKKITMDSVGRFPAIGKKIVVGQPRWNPAQPSYKDHSPFAYLDVEQGLNSPFVFSLLEDRYGRIWIGYSNGTLSVWDGNGFIHYVSLSSDWIVKLLEDSTGRIWIGTRGDGLIIWDGSEFTHYTTAEGLSGNYVNGLLEDKAGRVWIDTDTGLSVWDPESHPDEFIHYTATEGLGATIQGSRRSLLEDSAGRIWIGTDAGVSVWDPDNHPNEFTHYTTAAKSRGLSENPVRALLEDQAGRIWIGTIYGGVYVWEGNSFIHYTETEGLTGNPIWSLSEDQAGRIWIGTERGISVWDGKGFANFTMEEGLSSNSGWVLLKDRAGRIWIGGNQGISVWGWKSFRHYRKAEGLSENDVRVLLEDRDERVWIGARGGLSVWDGLGFSNYSQTEGLDYLINSLLEARNGQIWIGGSRGVNVWDPDLYEGQGGFIRYTQAEDLIGVLSLLEDRAGRIWIGGYQGISVWDPAAGGRFTHYTTAEGLSGNIVKSLLEDSAGRIWIGTDAGVSVWDPDAPTAVGGGRGGFTHYTEAEGFINEGANSLMEDRNGHIWMGDTKGVAVWDGSGFIHYTETEGLSDNMGRSLSQDKEGNIWIGTYKGLNRLSPTADGRQWRLQKFLKPEGLMGMSIMDILADSQKQLWLATTKGLSRLDLNTLQTDTSRPVLILREVQPFFDFIDWRQAQDSLKKGFEPMIGEQEIPFLKIDFDSVLAYANLPADPVFPHQVNDLTFHWSGVHGMTSHQIQYRYILEGNDSDWSPLLKENKVRFQNLHPGSYTFKVRAVGGNGLWSNTASYAFRIRPPWWWSGPAVAIYVLAAFGLLYFLRYWELRKQRRKLEKERQLNEQLRRVDRLKDQFLANTSHELRTPLQGIIGLSEALYDQEDKPEKQENLSMIISSGKRLSNLVNDILDFSKLRNYDIKLLRKPVDLRTLTNIVLRNNAPLAKGKDLQLINDLPEDLPAVDADENRLQQVLYNLVGNAIKFTEKGYVKVGTRNPEPRTQNEMLQIYVEDTGVGIPEKKREAIFQEFEQGDGSISREFTGTGLGLSISKKLVELHGGRMWVESIYADASADKPEIATGSTFFFTLPISGRKAAGVTSVATVSRMTTQIIPQENKAATPTVPIDHSSRVHILIVDDEPINQQVLKNHLSGDNFQFTQAMNGEEALKALERNRHFDLVLLDVMMPRMSGYQVCQKIRERFLPSELPVIMITAKNQVQDLVQGLALGANDYLAKPFTKEEFLARVKTQLELHRINAATGKFVPNEFLRSLGRDRITEVSLGDYTEREVTVLFADIRDYTSLSEIMTPEQNYRFVQAFSNRMGPLIQENRGFVNQYLGDAIMAIFPESPSDALRAAIAMQKALREYNEARKKKKRQPLRIGVGLHTGSLVMGIIGDQKRMDAATIADTVNTASRIESLSKHYGASILLSVDSLDKMEDSASFHFRHLGRVQVKGKKEPVGIYECYDGDSPEIALQKLKTIQDFEKGLAHFFAREFPEASAAFNQVLKKNPEDQTVRLFLNKSSRYTFEGVPANWTGVEIMTFK